MKKNYKEINTRDILLNQKPFSFSFPEFDQNLLDSISNIGLINPPILLLGKNNKFLIVSGLRRVLVCKKSGVEKLPCFIIKEKVADYENFILLNLRINLSHRELNDVEKANLFKLLIEAGVTRENIIKKYMPELKLEKSRKIYEDIMCLHSLDIKSKMKLNEWGLPLQTSAALARYSKADRDAIIKLAETLSPGINRLKEIIMLLEDIALAQKCSIADIIKMHSPVQDLNNNVSANKYSVHDFRSRKKEQVENLRHKLRELKYPQLAGLENKWNKCVRNLHLPPNIKIRPPASLDLTAIPSQGSGEKIKIEISFSTKKTITLSIQKLDEILNSGALEKVIRFLI